MEDYFLQVLGFNPMVPERMFMVHSQLYANGRGLNILRIICSIDL